LVLKGNNMSLNTLYETGKNISGDKDELDPLIMNIKNKEKFKTEFH